MQCLCVLPTVSLRSCEYSKNNKNNEKKCLSEPRFELGISDLFIWADSAHTVRNRVKQTGWGKFSQVVKQTGGIKRTVHRGMFRY